MAPMFWTHNIRESLNLDIGTDICWYPARTVGPRYSLIPTLAFVNNVVVARLPIQTLKNLSFVYSCLCPSDRTRTGDTLPFGVYR